MTSHFALLSELGRRKIGAPSRDEWNLGALLPKRPRPARSGDASNGHALLASLRCMQVAAPRLEPWNLVRELALLREARRDAVPSERMRLMDAIKAQKLPSPLASSIERMEMLTALKKRQICPPSPQSTTDTLLCAYEAYRMGDSMPDFD